MEKNSEYEDDRQPQRKRVGIVHKTYIMEHGTQKIQLYVINRYL